MRKLFTTVLSIVAASGLLGVAVVAAQNPLPSDRPAQGMQGQGMMQGGMPMMGMMQQMSQMIESCNKMMQAHIAQPAPTTEPVQPQNN